MQSPVNDPTKRSESPPADDDRDAVVARLTEHAGAGQLTLAEFDERAHRAYVATSRAELVAVTADLPLPTAALPTRRPARRWAVAVFGEPTIAGRWRLSGALRSVSLFGGRTLDLRNVELDAAEGTITTVALFGGDDIYSVDVAVTGVVLGGGNDEHGISDSVRPGGPVVRIRSHALFGGVDVYRVPAEARTGSLKEVREQITKRH